MAKERRSKAKPKREPRTEARPESNTMRTVTHGAQDDEVAGIRCTSCHSALSLVYETRKVNNRIIRRRECVHCGQRFRTTETVASAPE